MMNNNYLFKFTTVQLIYFLTRAVSIHNPVVHLKYSSIQQLAFQLHDKFLKRSDLLRGDTKLPWIMVD